MSKAYTDLMCSKPMYFEQAYLPSHLNKIVKKFSCAMVLFLSFVFQLTVNAQAIDYDAKKIQITLGTEPPDLNYLKATDQLSFFIIEHVMEGLLAYDENGELMPGIAERWEINAQGAKFFLRKNAQWSDGKPVTAHDFVFAWQSVVNPEIASPYAFILAPIKNAERITAGKLPPNQLGVKALNDYTLEVNFERPCAYFLNLTTFATYFPVREDFYLKQKERYFADVNNMIFNGPYTLTKWVHGASLRLDKNPNFWNADAIKINTIDVPYISADPNVIFNLFRNDEIVSADLAEDTLKFALQERMLIKSFNLGSLFFIEFNHRQNAITANLNFRKALQHVFNNQELVYKVIGLPGNKPADSLFPSWLLGEKEALNKENPYLKATVDINVARNYLDQAKKELKLDKLPAIVLLTSESPLATKEAEYFQALFKDTLGLDIKIDKQIFKQRLAKMAVGEFDIVLGGWGPDYNDPSTFGDLFYSKNSNNHGRYQNKRYDYWVEQAMNSSDMHVRVQAFAELQKIIYEDVVILPQFERGIVYVEKPQIKGIVRRIFGGDPSFRFAHIEKNLE